MAAQFIEDVSEFDDNSLEDGEELQQLDEQETEEAPVEDIAEEVEVEEPEEDEMPEKYKGKTVSEIVHMHQEAEKLVGRQSTEVGELRRLVDDYVKPTAPPSNAEPEEDIDFFENPQEAVNNAVSNNPALKEVQALTQDLKKQKIDAQLTANHPDYMATINDQGFADWVKGSKFRLELYQRADSNLDYEAADELLSTWKERTQAVTQAKTVAEKDVKVQRKAASTGTSRGTSETSSRKVYRRSDIMNLMRNDPERYLELSDEILKAYSEKRVR